MTEINNSISGAALCLGVDSEDLAKVLPALQAAKAARESGIRVQWTVDPTLARDDQRPVLMASFILETITYHKSTLTAAQDMPGPPEAKPKAEFNNSIMEDIAKAFFGPNKPTLPPAK